MEKNLVSVNSRNGLFYQVEQITLNTEVSNNPITLDNNYSHCIGFVVWKNLDDKGIIGLEKAGRTLVDKMPISFFFETKKVSLENSLIELNARAANSVVNLYVDKNGSPSMDSITIIFILSNTARENYVQRRFDYNVLNFPTGTTTRRKLNIIAQSRKVKAFFIEAVAMRKFSLADNSVTFIKNAFPDLILKDREFNSIDESLIKVDIPTREIFLEVDNSGSGTEEIIFFYEYEPI